MRPARRSLVELALAAANSAGLETRSPAQATPKRPGPVAARSDKTSAAPNQRISPVNNASGAASSLTDFTELSPGHAREPGKSTDARVNATTEYAQSPADAKPDRPNRRSSDRGSTKRRPVQDGTAPTHAALDAARQLHFSTMDALRRLQGNALAAFGSGPDECASTVIASTPLWRLRDYGGHDATSPLLIVAAPIKRPYIWDLAPSVSAIRFCLQQKLHVYLLEWMPASRATSHSGLGEYMLAISTCVEKVSRKSRDARPFLMGHSLGGTLAAIFGASAPATIRGLVLIGAPLSFEPQASRFRDALVGLVPADLSHSEPFPGSLLSQMSALASPATFVWSRMIDAALSVGDARALDVHRRVERWALDEVPLPGKLVHQIIESLYRENRLCCGTLRVRGKRVGPACLSAPTLAVVNMADDVAPLAAVEPFIDAMETKYTQIIEYEGERGVCLQHLGALVGRQAYAELWPQIISWIGHHG
jgi:polyhydroxyalkanoate synthase subunit PhaC